jgi:hypothetical protein
MVTIIGRNILPTSIGCEVGVSQCCHAVLMLLWICVHRWPCIYNSKFSWCRLWYLAGAEWYPSVIPTATISRNHLFTDVLAQPLSSYLQLSFSTRSYTSFPSPSPCWYTWCTFCNLACPGQPLSALIQVGEFRWCLSLHTILAWLEHCLHLSLPYEMHSILHFAFVR